MMLRIKAAFCCIPPDRFLKSSKRFSHNPYSFKSAAAAVVNFSPVILFMAALHLDSASARLISTLVWRYRDGQSYHQNYRKGTEARVHKRIGISSTDIFCLK